MASGHPHRAGPLGELRRREWRRLLLACALLAVWTRLLVPMAAQAAPMTADALSRAMCLSSAVGANEIDIPATPDHDDRLCPFCRSGESAVDLAPGPQAPALPVPGFVLRLVAFAPAAAFQQVSALHLPRGPPVPIATL